MLKSCLGIGDQPNQNDEDLLLMKKTLGEWRGTITGSVLIRAVAPEVEHRRRHSWYLVKNNSFYQLQTMLHKLIIECYKCTTNNKPTKNSTDNQMYQLK